MTLQRIEGALDTIVKSVHLSSIQTADQIIARRISSADVEELKPSFYTGDGLIYYVDNNKPMLAVTEPEYNLAFVHHERAYAQLVESCGTDDWHRVYYPDIKEAEEAIQAPGTRYVDLSSLVLDELRPGKSTLHIPLTSGSTINANTKQLLKTFYSEETRVESRLAQLYKLGVHLLKIDFPSPKRVLDLGRKGPFCLLSFLYHTFRLDLADNLPPKNAAIYASPQQVMNHESFRRISY